MKWFKETFTENEHKFIAKLLIMIFAPTFVFMLEPNHIANKSVIMLMKKHWITTLMAQLSLSILRIYM
ncbi:hypothetical protein J3R82DRAFT_10563 [Butyriboletus roseoflavus]|nr:hypothetical protein J3R82DRAFT_10563 [Butyriboletus roseoflavus]